MRVRKQSGGLFSRTTAPSADGQVPSSAPKAHRKMSFFLFFFPENIFKKVLTKLPLFRIITLAVADVAELADAHGSGPCESNFMGVQVPSSAPKRTVPIWVLFFFAFDIGLEGCVLENSPVDCFPAPPLRPQTGKSLHPHQKLIER